jgi:hypothetical protein
MTLKIEKSEEIHVLKFWKFPLDGLKVSHSYLPHKEKNSLDKGENI